MPATPIIRGQKCASIYIERRLLKRAHKRARELGLKSFSEYIARLMIAEFQTDGMAVRSTARRYQPSMVKPPVPVTIQLSPAIT